MVILYDQMELAAHPVIKKAVDVKWQLFGLKDTIFQLFITFAHLAFWFALAYEFPDNRVYYKPFKDNAWRIPVEILVFLTWFYFFTYVSVNVP